MWIFIESESDNGMGLLLEDLCHIVYICCAKGEM